MANVNLIWLGSRILCVIISLDIVSMLSSWKTKPKYLDLQIQGLQPALREWLSIWVGRGWIGLLTRADDSLQSSLWDQNLRFLPAPRPLPRPDPPERLQGPWEHGLQTPVLGLLKGLSSVPGGEVRACLFQTEFQAWAPQKGDGDGWGMGSVLAPRLQKGKRCFHWAPPILLNLFFFFSWWTLRLFSF